MVTGNFSYLMDKKLVCYLTSQCSVKGVLREIGDFLILTGETGTLIYVNTAQILYIEKYK